MKKELEILKKKLAIAELALRDIQEWNDDLELEWEDPGVRANEALHQMTLIVE